MTLDLFEATQAMAGIREPIGKQALVLHGMALPYVPDLLSELKAVLHASPFRHMATPGGFVMSVALSNCGRYGWTSDLNGYRYTELDPQTGKAWPAMPQVLLRLARAAAEQAGFEPFVPDACLINRYAPGTRLSLHQDKNERDLAAPIVSVSLGIPATFLFGGHERGDKAARIALRHGDVAVWGGVDRLRYHGIAPLKQASHPLLGSRRLNITLRKAG